VRGEHGEYMERGERAEEERNGERGDLSSSVRVHSKLLRLLQDVNLYFTLQQMSFES